MTKMPEGSPMGGSHDDPSRTDALDATQVLDEWLADGHDLLWTTDTGLTFGHLAVKVHAKDALRVWLDRVVTSGRPEGLLFDAEKGYTIGHMAMMEADAPCLEMWASTVFSQCPDTDPFTIPDACDGTVLTHAHTRASWVWPIIERVTGHPIHAHDQWPDVGEHLGIVIRMAKTCKALLGTDPTVQQIYDDMTNVFIPLWISKRGELRHVGDACLPHITPLVARLKPTDPMTIVQHALACVMEGDPIDINTLRLAMGSDTDAAASAIASASCAFPDPMRLAAWVQAIDLDA
jgi:hypothetical protein